MLRSNDSGSTWFPARNGLPISGTDVFGEVFFRPVMSLIEHDGALYAGIAGNGVYRSTNAGQSWTSVPGISGSIVHLAAINGQIIAVRDTLEGAEVYFTSVQQNQFQQASGAPVDSYVSALGISDDRVVLAVSPPLNSVVNEPLIYESLNGGASWQIAPQQLEVPFVSALAATEDGLFAATSGLGVWTQGNSLLGDVDGDDQLNIFDVSEFQECFTGPSSTVATECFPADLDGDNDVDFEDFALLQLEIEPR